jgi:hypothetical protein
MPLLRSGPPPEVRREVREAWERAQCPLPDGVVLDFESSSAEARAWGVLRLADGTPIARLSAAEVMAIACGDAAVLAGG